MYQAHYGIRKSGQARRTRNHQKLSRSVQKSSKIMKNHEIWVERSPRDKSGAFGFETVFWPLGNVGRPEGVTGVQGCSRGCLCAYGDRGACVSCVCIRSLHVHMSRPYHLLYIYSAYKQECKQAGNQGKSRQSPSKIVSKTLQKSLKFLKIFTKSS